MENLLWPPTVPNSLKAQTMPHPNQDSDSSSNDSGLPHLTLTTYAQPRVGVLHTYTTSVDTIPPEETPPALETLANALAAHIHLLKQELKTLRGEIS